MDAWAALAIRVAVQGGIARVVLVDLVEGSEGNSIIYGVGEEL